MRYRVWIAALAALSVTACDGHDITDVTPRCPVTQDLPDDWVVTAPGIQLEVQRSPYRYAVTDSNGNQVLATEAGGEATGYAGVAWTTGLVSYNPILAPGYTEFYPTLDPWRDRFDVVSAVQEPEQITLVLADPQDRRAPCINVSHTLRESSMRVEATLDGEVPRAWSVGFTSAIADEPQEAFIGFGERFNKTNQRGETVYSWAEEGGLGTGEGTIAGPSNPEPNGALMTYYPVPFFISSVGYGFWLDTTYRSEFNLASERDDAWRVWHVGPTLAYEVYVSDPDDARPWPYHLIDAFTEATGRPMLPPAWTLGPRRRIGRNSTANDVPEIQAMRDEDLAITSVDDSLHFFPAGHHVGREAEVEAWIDSAEALGYRVNCYFNSFLATEDEDTAIEDFALEGVANDYYWKLPNGEFPDLWVLTGGSVLQLYLVDFTNQEATNWYTAAFSWATDLGYSGWMYDFGEYVPGDGVASDGRSGEELHNAYPVQYAKAIHDRLESGPLAGDWLAFMRSGYTGSSHWVPMAWSGDPAASFEDSDGLPSMVRAGVNSGISGVPHWGGDIGGFHCNADGSTAADDELLTRWIQQGSMGTNMMDQNACVGGSSANKANIWRAPNAKEAWRFYARLHTRLFPYLYTLAHDATATGAPPIRHVFLEHPDRADLAGVDDAYYLGPALYVAPVVVRGDTDKVVALPDGLYLDWTDQQLVTGGDAVTIDAPLAKLPLLLRDGYLVPMLDATIDTLADETNAEVVGRDDVADVYDVVGLLSDGATASFTLYDGESFDAAVSGAFAPPAGFSEAAGEAELATCDGCYLVDDLGGGLQRVRISDASGSVDAGGVTLAADTARRVRWDLYLAP